MFEGSNRRQFQKGLDTEKARASRRNAQLSLRRKQREAHLQKKVRLLKKNDGEDGPLPSQQDIPKYIASIMQPDNPSLQLHGVTALRKILSAERDPPTQRIAKCGVIPKIIQFMFTTEQDRRDNNINIDIKNKLKFESAWVITNIAAATSDCVGAICRHGAIEAFVDLLRNATSPEIAEQAIWGLGNIAGDSRHFSNKVMKTGVTADLLSSLRTSANELQKNAIWALSNLFRSSQELRVSDLSNVVPAISKLLKENKDEDIVRDCLWTFNYISNGNSDDSEAISHYLAENGIINICMKLLQTEVAKYHIALNQEKTRQQQIYNYAGNIIKNTTKDALLKMNDVIYRPCLRIIGSLTSGNDDITQSVLDAGYLDIIEPFAYHFITAQRKEMMWSLANILAGTHQQIEAVLSRPNILRSIIDAATCDTFSVQKEACWCICNAASEAITEQKKVLAESGAIEALCNMLNPQNSINEQILLCILEGLEEFLSLYGAGGYNPFAIKIEECQGLDYLEERQSDIKITEETYNSIVDLMQKYWGNDENQFGINDNMEKDVLTDKLMANIDQNTNQFTFGSNNSFNIANNIYGENSRNNNNNNVLFQF